MKVVHNSNYINIKRNPATLKKPLKEESSFTHRIIMHRITMELVRHAAIGNHFSETIDH